MKYLKENGWILLFAVMGAIVGCCAFPYLPDQIPMHYNAAGTVDGWSSRFSIFIGPAVMLLILLLSIADQHFGWSVKPPKASSEPGQETSGKNNLKVRNMAFFLSCFLLFLMELYIIADSLMEAVWSLSVILPVLLGIFFLIIGNVLPKVKPNAAVGLRTRLTLSDSEIWYRTHRAAGKVMMFLGIVMMALALVPAQANILMLPAIAVLLLIWVYWYPRKVAEECGKFVTKEN